MDLHPATEPRQSNARSILRGVGLAAVGGLATFLCLPRENLSAGVVTPERRESAATPDLVNNALPQRGPRVEVPADAILSAGYAAPFVRTELHVPGSGDVIPVAWFVNGARQNQDASITWELVHSPLVCMTSGSDRGRDVGMLIQPDESFLRLSESQIRAELKRFPHRSFRAGDEVFCHSGAFARSGLRVSLPGDQVLSILPDASASALVPPSDGRSIPGLVVRGLLEIQSPVVASTVMSRVTAAKLSALEEVLSRFKDQRGGKEQASKITEEELKAHLVEHMSEISATIATKLSGSVEILHAAGSPDARARLVGHLTGFSSPLISQINNDGKMLEAMLTLVRGNAKSLAEAMTMAGMPLGTESEGSSESAGEVKSQLTVEEQEQLAQERRTRQLEVKSAVSFPIGQVASGSFEGGFKYVGENGSSDRNLTAQQSAETLNKALTKNSAKTTNQMRNQTNRSSMTAKGEGSSAGRVTFVDNEGRVSNIVDITAPVMTLPSGMHFDVVVRHNREMLGKAREFDVNAPKTLALACELHENLAVLEVSFAGLNRVALELLGREKPTKGSELPSLVKVWGYDVDPANPLTAGVARQVVSQFQEQTSVDVTKLTEREIWLLAAELLTREVMSLNQQKLKALDEVKAGVLQVVQSLHAKQGEILIPGIEDPNRRLAAIRAVITQCEDAAVRVGLYKDTIVAFAKKGGLAVPEGGLR